MKSYDNAKCRCCKDGVCFPVDVSKMEQAIGIERFECDKCHARFAWRRDQVWGTLTSDYAVMTTPGNR